MDLHSKQLPILTEECPITWRLDKMLASASIVVLSMLVGGLPAAAERADIVERSIEFHGGSIYSSSRSELTVCSKSGCYQVVAQIDGGLFDIEAAGRVRDHDRRVRITNHSVEHWRDGQPVEVAPDRAQSLRNWVMARAYFVFLPFRLDDESVVQHDLGIEVWEDRRLHKVKVTFVPGSSSGADDEFLYWFDPSTARLEQFAYGFAGDPGGVRFRRAFNFRRIGGLLFFDQENWGVDGEGLRVEEARPDRIEDWNRISTVTLDGISVQALR